MKPASLLLCLVACVPGLALLQATASADPPPAPPPGRIMPLRPMRRPVQPFAPAPSADVAAAPAAPPAAPAPVVVPSRAGTPTPVTATPAPAPRRRPVGRPKPPPPPAGPAPDVKLSLDVPTRQGAWTLHVTNAGDVPVRLAADARRVSLEVTPRGEAHPVHCELPVDMRPDDDLDRSLVLPPGRSYAESFEPRLYCFGEHALRALSPQAIVVARLGWPAGSLAEDRQAVSAIDGVEPVVGSLPSITSAPVALPDEPTPSTALVTATGAGEVPMLHLASSVAVDAQSFGDLAITVTLRNEGTRPVRLRFKPETGQCSASRFFAWSAARGSRRYFLS